MVSDLNSTLQVFLKTSLLKNIFLMTNISIEAISSTNLFLLRSVWFTIYHCFNRFLYMYNISNVTEQRRMFIRIAYRNPMFSTFYINDMDNSLGAILEFSL